MDSDHGGHAESEKKFSWPEAASHQGAPPGTGQDDAARDAGPEDSATVVAPAAGDSATGSERVRSGDCGGMAALSVPYRITAALALSVIGLLACGHLAMVFLHVAPSNTLTKQHGEVIDDWVYPEFEQNWKLFAPNPLQQNVSVHVRAEVSTADSQRSTTRWMSLSDEDGEAIRGNPLPSHVHQNELRRGWDFYVNSHDSKNRPNGLRGELSERYIRRIVMLRLSEHEYGGTVERIQVRSAVQSVGAPPWSDEKVSTKPGYRVLPWWNVATADLPESARAAQVSHGEGADK